jgi:hypothetical protein
MSGTFIRKSGILALITGYMKTLLIISFLALAVFASCKKVSGPANGNSVQPNNHLDSTVTISASINNILWKTDSAYGEYVNYSGNDSSRYSLEIIAYNDSSTTSMTIYITDYTGVNTYPVNPPLNSITYYKGNTRYYATTGQINITGNTYPDLTGTFNFTADTLTVTNGAFNVALP